MKHIAFVLVILVLSAASATSDDLVYVAITDHHDAARLNESPARAIHGTPGGYLVLGDWNDLAARGLEGRLLAESIGPAELYVGRTRDVTASQDLPVLYRSDDIIIARFSAPPSPDGPGGAGFFPLRNRTVQVEYVPSRRPTATGIYLYRLETEDNAASRKMLLLK